MIPLIDPWKPYPIVLFSPREQRDPWRTEMVSRQFNVEENPRYTPRDLNADGHQETFCNIYLWDWSRAMQAEIPHWIDAAGAPAAPGKGATELSANRTVDWLSVHGKVYGWAEVAEDTARAAARKGMPAVAVWQNHSGIGHVAAVLAARPGETWISQAGAKNYTRAPLAKGFGRIAPQFFAHL